MERGRVVWKLGVCYLGSGLFVGFFYIYVI